MKQTPWSTEVRITEEETVILQLMLSLDPGPMREFRPFLEVELDNAHAHMLFGQLAIATEKLRHSIAGAAL